MNKIYVFFILVCCVQSYLLPFSFRLRLRFLLPLIKITARIDRPQTQRNWQRPRIEIHQSPHIHWPQFDHYVTDYCQQNGVHVTVCLGLNFRTRPHYWINKRNHFPINEFISSLATGTLDLLWLYYTLLIFMYM